MITTVGQVLVNEALPEDLQDYTRIINNKSVKDLMRKVFDKYPDEYPQILQRLMEVGTDTAHAAGLSVSLRGLKKSQAAKRLLPELNNKINKIISNKKLSKEQRDKKVVSTLMEAIDPIKNETFKESIDEDNPFALQIDSGARGGVAQLSALRAGNLLVMDHKDRPVPIPITHSYAEGLDPVEYWASAYGSRKGEIAKKFAVADAGFLAKQLNNAVHRLIVTDDIPIPGTGLPVDADDDDNIGSVLAYDTAGFKAGTVITPRVHNVLKEQVKTVIVHSPVVSTSNKMGGVPRLAAGIRESGTFPATFQNIGLPAAQAISEKLSQAQLSMKHTAGMVGANYGVSSLSGFSGINQLAQVPKVFAGGATVSRVDGRIRKIEDAPQGGKYLYVDGEQHYVPLGMDLLKKVGDSVEAGDILTSGTANPAEIVQHRGIGEGRRYFVNTMRQVLKASGIKANRRNVELMARGLINHVRVTDPDGVGDYIYNDVVEYDNLAANYKPREGARLVNPEVAINKYLEQPVLHHTIGTRITPSVAKELSSFGIKHVNVHDREPQFIPEHHRAMDNLAYADDWMVGLSGFGISKNLQQHVARGSASNLDSYSYIPGLAEGANFGRKPNTPY